MIGLTYRVVPVEGESYEFTTTLADEMAWERYATTHRLPILPNQQDLNAFTMMSNGAVLAYSNAKWRLGETRPLEDFAATLVSVMPATEDPSEVGLPAPFPEGDMDEAAGGTSDSDPDPS